MSKVPDPTYEKWVEMQLVDNPCRGRDVTLPHLKRLGGEWQCTQPTSHTLKYVYVGRGATPKAAYHQMMRVKWDDHERKPPNSRSDPIT